MAACALLLVLGGAAKIGRPDNTVRAMRSLRLPANSTTVRLLAAAEVAIGLAAVVIGGRVAALLMALSYLGFACVVILAMGRGAALSSCGCFGTPDTPPTVTHLLVTLAASGVAAAAVARPVGPLVDGLGSQPLWGAPFVMLTACCVWFAYVALAVLPGTTVFSKGQDQ